MASLAEFHVLLRFTAPALLDVLGSRLSRGDPDTLRDVVRESARRSVSFIAPVLTAACLGEKGFTSREAVPAITAGASIARFAASLVAIVTSAAQNDKALKLSDIHAHSMLRTPTGVDVPLTTSRNTVPDNGRDTVSKLRE